MTTRRLAVGSLLGLALICTLAGPAAANGTEYSDQKGTAKDCASIGLSSTKTVALAASAGSTLTSEGLTLNIVNGTSVSWSATPDVKVFKVVVQGSAGYRKYWNVIPTSGLVPPSSKEGIPPSVTSTFACVTNTPNPVLPDASLAVALPLAAGAAASIGWFVRRGRTQRLS